MKVPKARGIYAITCSTTGDTYIGSSRNVRQRWNDHRCHLRAGDHANHRLQSLFNAHGETSLVVSVLEECEDDALSAREAAWVERERPALNLATVSADFKRRPPAPEGVPISIPMTREERKRLKLVCIRLGVPMKYEGTRWLMDRLAQEERKLSK